MLMTEDRGLNKAYCMDCFSSQASEGDANTYQINALRFKYTLPLLLTTVLQNSYHCSNFAVRKAKA